MAPATQVLPLPCLMLLLLCRAPDAGAQTDQDFKLNQPQNKVSVKAGETLTLNCTVSGSFLVPGPVKWLKGWGSENKTVYEDTGTYPRVTRAVSGSNTDFTIHIKDIQPEDGGTYYCVKFQKSFSVVNEFFQRGGGTDVSVHAKPSTPLVSGPKWKVGPGQPVTFSCTAEGFSPKDIGVKWFKGQNPISSQAPQVTEGRNKSYKMSSSVTVVLEEGDVLLQLICEVQHSASPTLLRGMYQLNRILRVSPKVDVSTDQTSPVEVNKTVNFTCHVKRFYPDDVSISWLENGMKIKVENNSQPLSSSQGLFEMKSWVEVQATEEKNGSAFTCLVVHGPRLPIKHSATLWIASPDREQSNGVLLSSILVLTLGILLEKGLFGGLLFFFFKHMKGKASGMVPCRALCQHPIPQGRSQGLATTSHVL